MPKTPKPASAKVRAISLAVHAAGLTLYTAWHDGDCQLPDGFFETLPTYYGSGLIAEPLAADDVAGLIEARRVVAAAEQAGGWDKTRPWGGPERPALAALDAALILLGIDPHREREPLAQGIPRAADAAEEAA